MTTTSTSWRLLLLLLALGATALLTAADREVSDDAVASAEAPTQAEAEKAPTVADPLPFDHGAHEKPFRRIGLTCIDCHPVGLRSPTVEPAAPPPPRTSCHSCHRRQVQGAPRQAKARCAQCHPVREELKPDSHELGWQDDHGPEARALRAGCDQCHSKGQCIDCHDARGALSASPHGAGFEVFHGVEARLDLVGCVSCHAAETCARCHDSGGRPL